MLFFRCFCLFLVSAYVRVNVVSFPVSNLFCGREGLVTLQLYYKQQ